MPLSNHVSLHYGIIPNHIGLGCLFRSSVGVVVDGMAAREPELSLR